MLFKSIALIRSAILPFVGGSASIRTKNLRDLVAALLCQLSYWAR